MLGFLLSAGMAQTSTAQSFGSADDSTSIRAIVADLDSAWAHADADRWASHYSQDADFVNILGMYMADTKAMHARHHEIFTGVFKGSTHVGTLRRLRFLDASVAIADVDVEVTGFKALPPGVVPTAPGVLRTRMKHILTKFGDEWRIVATQNTAVAPMPGK
jgi:uncharacterized protein (TIGR02246 family)